MKLFVASRSEPDLENAFEPFTSITICADNIEADVEHYIRSRISQSRWKNSQDYESVVNTLTQKADGMFLWAHCQLEELCKVRTKIGLESLRDLPRGLQRIYQGIASRVDGVDKELARRIFQFIMFSNRPLDISELVDAIAIEDDSVCLKDLEKMKLYRPEEVLEICGSLIRCSESTRTLKLAHHSVREFLATPALEDGAVNDFHMPENECHFHLVKRCQKYLNLEDFGSREFPSYGDQGRESLENDRLQDTIPDHPFLDYAARQWVSHAIAIRPSGNLLLGGKVDNSGTREKLWPDIQKLFSSNGGNFVYWTSVLRYAHGEYKYPLSIKPLHICAIHNMREEARRLLARDYPCNDLTEDHRSSLHLALENGNTEMVQLLTKAGAPLEKANISGRRPLHVAVESGNGHAVEILVEAGANVTAPHPDGDFPLSIAVENGWNELVPILLRTADLSSCLHDGRTVLHLAVELGHEAIVKQIIEYRIDLNKTDRNGWTPIHFSAHHGHTRITKLLLQHKADGAACDVNGWTPLHAAIDKRHLESAVILLEWRARNVTSLSTRLPKESESVSTSSNIQLYQLDDPPLSAAPRPSDRLTSAGVSAFPRSTSSDYGAFTLEGRYSLRPHCREPSVQASASLPPSRIEARRRRDLALFGGSGSSFDQGAQSSRGVQSRGLPGKYELGRQPSTPTTPSLTDYLARAEAPLIGSSTRTETRKAYMPTPLFLAVSNRFSAGVELLLKFSPDLSDISECLDSIISPVDLFILKLLLSKVPGAETNNTLQKVAKMNSPRIHLLFLEAYHVYHRGTHPLIVAAKDNYFEVLKLALETFQDNSPPSRNYLYERFESAVKSSNFKAAALLTEYGGAHRMNELKDGTTLLHEVVKAGNEKAVSFLDKSGVKLCIHDQDGCLPLHLAVKCNQLAIVKHLLSYDSSSSLAATDKMGRTAFHEASKRDLQSIMEIMISHDSTIVEAVDYEGRTALHLVAEQRHQANFEFGLRTAIELLLDFGAQIEAKDDVGETALHKASNCGFMPTVTLLLRKGANLEQKDGSGRTLLQKVIERQQEHLIQLFLEKSFISPVSRKYSVDLKDKDILISGQRAKLGERNDSPMTVFHRAIWNGCLEATQVLLEHGANPKSQDMVFGTYPLHCAVHNGDEKFVKMLIVKGVDIDAEDKNKETAMHWAAWRGNKNALKCLLDHGARYDVKDMVGKTPLHWAAWNGEEEINRMLLEAGADTAAEDDEKETPLHWAAYNGRQASTSLILNKTRDINVRDRMGKTALHRAVEGRHSPVVSIILARDCDIDAQDKDGRTTLHWAAWNGDEAIVQMLLVKGASTGARDMEGRSPLYRAAERGHKQVLQLLIHSGADSEAKDNYGETALHRASKVGDKAMVSLLLDTGSNIRAKTTSIWTSGERRISGETPLHWAAWTGHLGVVLLLLHKGADCKAMDTSGKTPLDRAVQEGHEAVVDVLEAQLLSICSS